MEISVRDLHNDTIKVIKNSGLKSLIDYVTHILLISDTLLRSFIPPQVCKITPKLCHICGCELCVIPKDVKIDLNRYRRRLVTVLQKKSVGIHTDNILFISTSDVDYKVTVFPDG